MLERKTLLLLLTSAGCLLLFALQPAPCRAERNSRIGEADIGEAGELFVEYGQDAFEETSPLDTGRDVATYFNVGYNLNQRLQLRARLLANDLSGSDVIFDPVLSTLTSADGWGVDFRVMMDRTEGVYPTADNPQFTPASAFSVGLGFTGRRLESSTVDSTMNSAYGYLLYSTDFLPELRAHTMFGIESFSSDWKRGGKTTIGMGADYDLMRWGNRKSAVQLTANGLIDIVNVRKPSFDSGRVTRFDAGLRVLLHEHFAGYAGYAVVNDTFADKNSQGFFYGVELRGNPSRLVRSEKPLPEEEAPPPEEAAPAEEAAPREEAAAPVPEGEPAVQPPPEGGEEGAGGNGEVPEGGKASSALPQGESGAPPLVPPLRISNGEAEPQDASRPAAAIQSAQPAHPSQPQPTTSARIVRPPAIENPWELLPIGYDWHPPQATVREKVSAPVELGRPVPAAKGVDLRTYESGRFHILSNL